MNEPGTSEPVLLDATGLICPLPVLRTRKAMKSVPPGGMLEVLATDPAAVKDLAAFCEATGHRLLDWSEQDGVFRFRLQRAA
jgi:tRNA 2-thiouridine synthesizing protein A